ncbi:putative RWP-RK domain-containing protein [Hibiscus syriacus]|uniref:RWP-RK domain-containing protein n=1 Tax=Hibiscus syriacus TaxID=106335 RepID=A0A6A3AMC3_HIBSY|nr:uncharacterized protein LOC120124987 [Hibiscus syriacus]KAE8705276.1 putative RWP-RK domain-containing protein [Hibiscus syriacus]
MGSPTPKLSLYSFPSKAKEPPGMITPPIHASVSIPFKWEEAPGKPRRPYRGENETDTISRSKSNVARCLQLPPRLLSESKVANIPSPTAVLEGPDACRFVSNTLSFGKVGSLRRLDKVVYGSSRRGSFRKAGRNVQGSFHFSTPVVDGGDVEVKITTVRKKPSFLNLSQAGSHILASIYESFKKVVPWRRKHEKMQKNDSSNALPSSDLRDQLFELQSTH